MTKQKIIKLKWGKYYGKPDFSPKIIFKDMHERFGHAQFQFCPIFKYGRLKKVMIYRIQQEEKDKVYELECQGQKEFQICTWTHKGLVHPNIWREFYCKEHKAICHDVYVPLGSNVIRFDSLSTFMIRFEKEEK